MKKFVMQYIYRCVATLVFFFPCVLSYSGNVWQWQNPIPDGDSFSAIWGSSDGHVFEIGSSGIIYYYDGSSWNSINSGTSECLMDVWGSSKDDVFVVGWNGSILHYNGANWSPMSSGTTLHLCGVWGSSDHDVYAVGTDEGGNSSILHYDGSSWSTTKSWNDQNLFEVWGSSSNDVYVVGENVSGSSALFHYNGTEWSSVVIPEESRLWDVWGSSNSDVFVVGNDGIIMHYDGSVWSVMESTTSSMLEGIWGLSENNVYAVGSDGAILHYDGSNWSSMGSYPTENFYGIWGTSENNLIAVGSESIMLYEGTEWFSMSRGESFIFFDAWGNSPSDIYVVGMAPCGRMTASSVSEIVLHFDGLDWKIMNRFLAEFGTSLRGVWGEVNSVFSVGDNNTIVYYDGNSWSLFNGDTPDMNYLNAVWGSASNDVYIVGYGVSGGILLHYDGTNLNTLDNGGSSDLGGVWGSSGSDVFVVGNDGGGHELILHYDGTNWITMSSGTTEMLSDIWGDSGSDVFAVGYNGTILHYNGSIWEALDSGTTHYLFDVYGTSGSNVYAVGEGGTFLHYDGTNWNTLNSGTTETLYGVWCSTDGDMLTLCGSGGELIQKSFTININTPENFPDPNFRAAVETIMGVSPGEKFTAEEAAVITTMNVSSQNIVNVTGIEFFTGLNYFDCSYNNLTSLNISQNTALSTLRCQHNQINSLDVSNNYNLIDVICSYNYLTNISSFVSNDVINVGDKVDIRFNDLDYGDWNDVLALKNRLGNPTFSGDPVSGWLLSGFAYTPQNNYDPYDFTNEVFTLTSFQVTLNDCAPITYSLHLYGHATNGDNNSIARIVITNPTGTVVGDSDQGGMFINPESVSFNSQMYPVSSNTITSGTYALSISDATGTVETYSIFLSSTDLPWPVPTIKSPQPFSSISSEPVISWEPYISDGRSIVDPDLLNETYGYNLWVYAPSVGSVWGYGEGPIAPDQTTSLIYNFNDTASSGYETLPPGTYSFALNTYENMPRTIQDDSITFTRCSVANVEAFVPSNQNITIQSPNGGETWQAGTTHNIVYSATASIQSVSLSYSINNGSSWNMIAGPVTASGTYSWMIPSASSTTCLVRVTDASGTDWDASDSVFAIISSLSNRIVSIDPSSIEVYRGENTELTIRISDTTDLLGYRVALNLDPSKVTYVDGSATKMGTSTEIGWGPIVVNSGSPELAIFSCACASGTISSGSASLMKFQLHVNGSLPDFTPISVTFNPLTSLNEDAIAYNAEIWNATVIGPNHQPYFTSGTPVCVAEDCGPQTIAWATDISAGTAYESWQSLFFTVEGYNPILFSATPEIDPSGVLRFTPALNANGITSATVYLHDSGGTENGGINVSPAHSLIISVTPVNDAPSFIHGATVTIVNMMPPMIHSFPGFATAVTAGPPDEAGQFLYFPQINNHPEKFTIQPNIPGGVGIQSATLLIMPATNAHGVIQAQVCLYDNGGQDLGGINHSATESFTIRMYKRFGWGDLNANNQAGSVDASLLLQYQALLIETFPGFPQNEYPEYYPPYYSVAFPQAADVNADGIAGTLDASLILQKYVFLIEYFPADLNHDQWGPDAPMPPAKVAMRNVERRLTVSVEGQGSSWIVKFKLDNALDLSGMRLVLLYDPAQVSVDEKAAQWLVPNGMLVTNNLQEGRFIVAGALSVPLGEGSSELMSVKFDRIADSASSIVIRLDEAMTQFNDGQIQLTPNSAMVFDLMNPAVIREWMIH